MSAGILRDAAFLCGFIAGTYDLKGEQGPPAYLQPYIERIMNAHAEQADQAEAGGVYKMPVFMRSRLRAKPVLEEEKIAPVPDAAKTPKPTETEAGNHGAETSKKAETLQSEARNFIKPPKQHGGSRLLPHLAEIQKAHDAGETNGSIGKRYDVTAQSIANLLKGHGAYHPAGTRPKEKEPEVAPKDSQRPSRSGQDSKPIPERIPLDDGYIGRRSDGKLRDEDWPDIQAMIRKGAQLPVLCTKYGITDRAKMKDFIDRHVLAEARANDKAELGRRL